MQIGNYKIIRKIATGGMAEIFLAKGLDDPLERQLVVKRILPTHTQNRDIVRMLVDEALIAARLAHQNIASVYELDEDGGQLYLVMEYVHGQDIRRVCERGLKREAYLPLPLACRIIADAARGLHYAHNRHDELGNPLHIVHRDVSPQNLIVGYDGVTRIVDFGIAKAADKIATTRTGQLKGKFSYMSPEQVLGRPLDQRSDVFALGTILYEITTVTRLFKGPNDLKTIKLVAQAPITPPRQLNGAIPLELEVIIMRALERDPNLRYHSAQALADDLDRLLSHAEASTNDLAQYMRGIFPDQEVGDEWTRDEGEEVPTTLWQKELDPTQIRFTAQGVSMADDHFNSPDIQDNRQTLQPTVSEQLGGDAAPAPDLPTPHYDPNEDFEGDFERRRKHNRIIVISSVVALLIVGVVAWLLVGTVLINETVEAENPPEPEGEVGPPTWVELPMAKMEVRTDPPGAYIVVNGDLKEGITPWEVDIIKDRPNTISVFKEGYLPEHQFLALGVELSNGVDIALKEEPPIKEMPAELDPNNPNAMAQPGTEDPPGEADPNAPVDPNAPPEEPDPEPRQIVLPNFGKVYVRSQNPADDGADVWLDGVLVGQTPVTVEHVALGHYHHVLVKKTSKAPVVTLFKMSNAEYLVEVLFNEGVFLDRKAQLNVEVFPRTAQLEINGEVTNGMARVDFEKGDLVHVAASQTDHESWQYTFHTTPVGSYEVRPSLAQFKDAPAKVKWLYPEDKYWYACLKRPGKSVCWDDQFARDAKQVMSGTYELAMWEQLHGKASNRRRPTNTPEITLLPLHYYEIELDFTGDEVIATPHEPVPWDPVAEAEEKAKQKK